MSHRIPNEQQRAVIEANEGAFCVDAAAGVGKTTVLTERTKRLILQRKAPYDRILLVTFTVKAAAEMAERVHRATGLHLPWTTNFHRLCTKLLRRYPEFGVPKGYTVADTDAQASIVQKCARDLHGIKRLEAKVVKDVLAQVECARMHRMGYSTSGRTLEASRTSLLEGLAVAYEEELRRRNKIDFDRIILDIVWGLRNNPDLRARIASLWDFVMVDEAQDTDQAQFELISYLVPHGNIMLVGDIDQSIFAFRRARFHNILDFIKTYQATVLPLELNYRSNAEILSAANQVISRNEERLPKVLRPTLGGGGEVRLIQAFSGGSEASWIAQEIQRALDGGTPLNQVAILYRISSLSRELEAALTRKSIPYRVVGGLRFWERAEVRDTLAHVWVVMGSQEPSFWERVFDCMALGVGKKTFARLAQAPSIEAGLRAGALPSSLTWLTRLDQARTMDETLSAKVRWFMAATGYQTRLKRLHDEENATQRIANVDECLNALAQVLDPEEWLADVSLGQPGPDEDSRRPVVVLSTIHAAKGLEWDHVFLVGVNEGILPHARACRQVEIEEERRLLYVAITRAKHRIALTYATSRMVNGTTMPTPASFFVRELPYLTPQRVG